MYGQRPEDVSQVEKGRYNAFYDSNDYKSIEDLETVYNNISLKTKYKFLKPGTEYKVLDICGKDYKFAKVCLKNGKIGWILSSNISDRSALAALLPFRKDFLYLVESKGVVPNMTREEVFVTTKIFMTPDAQQNCIQFNNYIEYNHNTKALDNDGIIQNIMECLKFYNNMLYYASGVNGAFYYQNKIDLKLKKVTRSDSTDFNPSIMNMGFKDDILTTMWTFTDNSISFSIKNESANSIKLLWDDMVFINYANKSQRLIHKGVKYSEKDLPQHVSVVGNHSTFSDILLPSDNIHYCELHKQWESNSLIFSNGVLSPNDDTFTQSLKDMKLRLIFPIIFNEKRIEYELTFEAENIDFILQHGDYDGHNPL